MTDPEKAGKSTIAGVLKRDYGAYVRHWGRVDNDTVYLQPLSGDVQAGPDQLFVWDRSWASEHVYGRLLNRDRRLARDPWLGEWLYGRSVQTVGACAIITGPRPDVLAAKRTGDDLPVEPTDEQNAFIGYGNRFHWQVIHNDHTDGSDTEVASLLVSMARSMCAGLRNGPITPPAYCGPLGARVVFVGERRNDSTPNPPPGAWLPFTSRFTEMYGRAIGEEAFGCGWTNAADDVREPVANADLVVACGQSAWTWALKQAPRGSVLRVPHPAYLYRWGSQRGQIPSIEATLRSEVSSVFNLRRSHGAA